MRKIKRDKPIGVIIHTYMEISQGNSPCSYIYLKKAKMSSSLFIFYLFSSINQRTGGQNRSCPRVERVGIRGGGGGGERG
jgi:hypothetical protein